MMKQIFRKMSVVLLASALMAPVCLLAQDKEEKDKSAKDKKGNEQIIISRSNDKDEKMVIVVDGDKVTVNGKPIEDLKDNDVRVLRTKTGSRGNWTYGGGEQGLAGSWNDNYALLNMDNNRAMLGVTTEKADKGVKIQTITKESGAEKAGLKKDDIITKIDDKTIEDPDDLSKAVTAHKPGEKVSVGYIRDGKEQKVTAELSKWKGAVSVFGYKANDQFKMPDMNFDMPRIQAMPRVRGQAFNTWSWAGGAPRLGVSVQDTEDGKGVKVLDVDEDGNGAKAGIKENDVITEVDGKAVNSADEIAKVMKDSKDKVSVKMKVLRNGKTENLDVKIPRRLKTTDL